MKVRSRAGSAGPDTFAPVPLSDDPTGGRRGGARRLLSTLAVGLLVLVMLALGPGIPGSSTQVLRVATTSMTPTLHPGDRVLVSGAQRGAGEWQHDDVVVVDRGNGPWLIKRLVGLPGDVIAIKDGRLWRNGIPLEESWSDPTLIDSVYFGPVQVPAGQVFVMGDNGGDSRDSRDFGTIDEQALRARVVGIAWPLSRFGGLS